MANSDTRQKALEVQALYKSNCQRIKASKNLTDTARLRAVALETREARAALRTLAQASEADQAEAAHSARARLFGLAGTRGADLISFRDAHDRVARATTPKQLRELMDMAERNGDAEMSAAAAARAWDMSGGSMPGSAYPSIVRDWLDSHPGKQADAAELAALLDGGSRQQRLSDRLHFDLQTDELLGHLNEDQVLAQTGLADESTA